MYASVHTDRSGRVFVSGDHAAAAMDGVDAQQFADAIPLPEGTDLVPLPREVVAFDRGGRARPLAKGRLALGAVLPPGYLRALAPSYRDDPAARPLEPLPYAAVAADERGDVVVAAIGLPTRRSREPEDGHAAGRPAVRAHPASAVARQLARCAKENGCVAARSGIGRGVLPIPLGAPAAERPRLPVALRSGYAGTPREQASFHPDERDVVAIALDHFAHGGSAVGFGRACEGEPLALIRVLEEATAEIRERVPGAAVHLETTGSDPAALRRAIEAGLTEITVRIGSARSDTYDALHGPVAHRWSDVRASLQLAAERGIALTLALLTLPGLTDQGAEIDATIALLGELAGGRIELRDLGADPSRAIAALPRGRGLGMKVLLARIAEADHFRIADAPNAAVAASA